MAKELRKVSHEENLPAVPDEIAALLEEHAGEGVSRARGDNLVPTISIAQSLSPFVLDGRAKAGDFFFPTMGKTVPGVEGIHFQPAWHENMWLEFKSRDDGGGFVRAYPWLGFRDAAETDPILPDGIRCVTKWPPKYVSEAGNDVSHHRPWAGVYWDENQNGQEFVIKLTGMNHTVSKNWNSAAMFANKLASGNSRPIWGQIYKLTTFQKRNAKGTFFVLNVGPPTPIERAAEIVGPDIRRATAMGRLLRESFEKKEREVGVDENDASGDRSGDRGDEQARM